MPRTTIRGLCTTLVLLAACEPADDGEWISPGTVETRNGVRMEQVPLAQVVPAVGAGDVETASCGFTLFRPDGSGQVQIHFAADSGVTHRAFVTVGQAGRLLRYSELRVTTAATSSIVIDVPEGTGGATNVTEGGARVTIGKGTADEALESAVLGHPARTVERMLARCGRADATS